MAMPTMERRWIVPHLDRLSNDELREFTRSIPGDVPATVRRDLVHYAGNVIASRAWRAVGRIAEARLCRERCEAAYERIPMKWRWI